MSNRDIVVIGGSSGASIPLRETLGGLSANIPAAIFVVLHVPALGTGILSTLAGGAGKLAVRPAEHGLSIENGHVYLATPDRHLMLASGRMILGRGPPENMARPAVDALFRSAALHYGPRVIGVVLSGLLSDGAAGLSAIKRCGGVAVVQDPADAIADEMPRRALEATTVDLCVPSDRLGDVLSDLVCDEPGCAMPIPPEIRLEVEIASGEPIGSNSLIEIANPAALTCPACGGDAFEAEDRESLAFSLSGRACLHRRCAGKAPGRPCRRGPARGAPHYRRARGSGAPDGGGRAAQRTSDDCANVSGESRRISRIRRHNSPGYATLVRSEAHKEVDGPQVMAEKSPVDMALELAAEKRLLVKAEADIEAGWTRLRNQQDLLSSLQAAGENTREAERLVQLMKQSLIEWERHRVLIEQRIAYLEHGAFP